MGLDLPYWIEDPDFDIDFHVRNLALPSPGNDHQLAEQVARIVSRPLDRRRPLWELYVIEGLGARLRRRAHEDPPRHDRRRLGCPDAGRAARPGPRLPARGRARPPGSPRSMPSDAAAAAAHRHRVPAPARRRSVRLNVRMLRQLAASHRQRRPPGHGRPGRPAAARPARATRCASGCGAATRSTRRRPCRPPPAPRTPFNRSIGPHRRFAFTSIPLDDAKEVKNKLGTTFNDVVMALCSATLRRYLEERGVLPDEPLIAMVPVSIRSGDEDEAYQNRVSGLLCNLATDEKDPIERLHEDPGLDELGQGDARRHPGRDACRTTRCSPRRPSRPGPCGCTAARASPTA